MDRDTGTTGIMCPFCGEDMKRRGSRWHCGDCGQGWTLQQLHQIEQEHDIETGRTVMIKETDRHGTD
jgi:tRNA(Ile2) C34 agmatinyltransferase TiaS